MAANTIVTRYQDEVGRLASTVVVVEGTDPGDDNYGPLVLVNDNPAQVAKILSTTGAWLLSYAAPQPVVLAALLHSTCDASSAVSPTPTVELLGYTSDPTSGFPGTPDFAAAFTVPAWSGGGSARWPMQPWLDLTAAVGYNPSGFRYWALRIANQSQNIQVGGLKLYAETMTLQSDFREGWTRSTRRPAIRHKTSFEVETIYARLTSRWACQGSLFAPTAEAALLEEQWHDAAGGVLPFVVVPNALRNQCYFVRHAGESRGEAVPFYHETDDIEWLDLPVAFEEVGRGLRPGT